MLEPTEGKIKVFQENDLGTIRRVLLKAEFDPNEPETRTFRISRRGEFGLYLELDIYKPTQRRIDELEKDNADLQGLVDEMAETIENVEDMEDF